ncbi:DUF421 domain-containing protein [Alicyclobacillus mengziensis]|uniref:DUF421 domain-containing protein n=1 Tax=Alicyclobacillus mengziensis TaxID=2931921 RepID=UPI002012CC1F|nr:DUF421 domain-containing protein [Alicyclobacillus mengziensis]
MQIPWWQFGFRIVVLYIVVMIALRLMGKREIGQLSVFDFVVSMMIAELSTLPMEDTGIPLYVSLVSIGVLVLLQVGVAILQIKNHRFRHWVEGEPVVLIEHGQIRDGQMRKMRYSMSDLLLQLREKGVAAVADVEFAILENSGKLSVLPKAAKRPLTASDLGQPVTEERLPLPLIIDSDPVRSTLQTIGRDENWLRQEMERRGYSAFDKVFYAAIDSNGTIFIDPRDPPSGNWQKNSPLK